MNSKIEYLYRHARFCGLTKEIITKETDKSFMIGKTRIPKDEILRCGRYTCGDSYYPTSYLLPTDDLDYEYLCMSTDAKISRAFETGKFVKYVRLNNQEVYERLLELAKEIL